MSCESGDFSKHLQRYLPFYLFTSICLTLIFHEIRFLAVDFTVQKQMNLGEIEQAMRLVRGLDIATALIVIATFLKITPERYVLIRKMSFVLGVIGIILLIGVIVIKEYYTVFSPLALLPSVLLYLAWLFLYLKAKRTDMSVWEFEDKSKGFKVKIVFFFLTLFLLALLPIYVGGVVFVELAPEDFFNNWKKFEAQAVVYNSARISAVSWIGAVSAALVGMLFLVYRSAVKELKE
ncbi:MAG: hypothetical protein KAT46_03325 [Deltaproteobacteria bacterium]|nr:hypothetical protein [Deltaproteobacteria bacterium]